MIIDLHTHTRISDGGLTPAQLVARAEALRVDVLSITDHDTVAAYSDLPATSVRVVPGVEFSTCWQTVGIHVLGLNVRLGADALEQAVEHQTRARRQRAERIAEKLERLGIEAPLDGARRIAGHDVVGRPHFAAHLVEAGVVADAAEAFKRYLGHGKAGDVGQQWAPMSRIVEWIRGAGGVAVLAHPAAYRLTAARLRRLLGDFIEAGGEGLEVVSGQQNPDMTAHLATLSQELGLLASCGSDFHQPAPWSELGRFARLPDQCAPVWDRW